MPNLTASRRDDWKAEQERTYKFYNSLKTTSLKCNYGSKDCETCEDKDCTWRQFLLNSPY